MCVYGGQAGFVIMLLAAVGAALAHPWRGRQHGQAGSHRVVYAAGCISQRSGGGATSETVYVGLIAMQSETAIVRFIRDRGEA